MVNPPVRIGLTLIRRQGWIRLFYLPESSAKKKRCLQMIPG
ncbi:hypothetical protein LT85_0829 [Collimonas arenae]|uniref:Uncharacterized protein n=1 Tax=Collimonas arenae TaxID=279058 RepID=A0A0A1F8I8_9BURK|nr:hypothetical protein LT85_0829 [Collimonas arenae]